MEFLVGDVVFKNLAVRAVVLEALVGVVVRHKHKSVHDVVVTLVGNGGFHNLAAGEGVVLAPEVEGQFTGVLKHGGKNLYHGAVVVLHDGFSQRLLTALVHLFLHKGDDVLAFGRPERLLGHEVEKRLVVVFASENLVELLVEGRVHVVLQFA